MKYFLWIFLFFFSGLSVYADTDSKVARPVLFALKPIDAGAINQKNRNVWTIAVIDQLTRFRLEPLREIITVPKSLIDSLIPEMASAEAVVSNEICRKMANRLKCTHLLSQKFEISQPEKKLQYYIEIINAKDNQITFTLEKEISLEHFAPGVDSCILTAIKSIQPGIYPETERFFQLSLLSPNFKNVKQLGELYILEKGKQKNDLELAREYEKLVERDPLLLLANYSCALAYFRGKEYEKAANYLKQLLDLTPVHSSLFITLAQSYRFAGQYQEALNVTVKCDRMRLRGIPFLLEKAMAFEGLNQRGSALNTYLQILTINPNQPQALLFLAQQRNNEANYNEGLQYAEKLLSADPSNGKAGFEKGRALCALGKYDEAFTVLKTAASSTPDDPLILQWLGDLCIRKQLYKEAIDRYKQASKAAPENFDLYIKTSNALQLANQNDEALKTLKNISNRFKDKPQLFKEIGLLEYKLDNLDSALNHLSFFCRSDSSSAEVYLVLGHIYNKKSDFKAAYNNYSRSMSISGPTIECKLAIADVYLKTKDHVSARNILKEVLAERAEKTANRMMGEAFLQAGDLRNALTYYLKERELHGDDPMVQEKIANLYFFQGFYAPAKTEFLHLVKLSPKHHDAYYYLAILDLREGQINSSEQYLKKAEKLGEGNATIHYHLGINFENNKMLENAISSYNKCLSFEPTNQNALLNLADVYIKAEKDSAAAETYIKLFNIDNAKYSANLANAGHLFFKLNLFDKAIGAYSTFLDKKFNDFSVNVGYATIMYNRKDYSKVISLLKSINGSWLKDDKIVTMLADSYFKTGQYALALPHLSTLLSLDDQNRFAIKHSAIALEKTADTLKAISMYERFLKLPPEKDRADAAFHLGELYESQKLQDKAILQYENNIKEYPEDLRNHTNLGALYYRDGKYVKAQKILETAVSFANATPVLHKMLAQTYSAQNENPKAIQYYEKYLKSVPNDASAWKEAGICHFTLKDYSKAIPAFTKARELSSTEDFEVAYLLGCSYLETDNYSKAIAPLGRARALNDKDSRVYDALAQCYRNLKETSTLTAILTEWIAIDPKRYDIKIELGSLMLDAKKITEAISMLTEASRFIPSEPKPYLLLAQAYEILGNDSLRFKNLSTALQFAPNNWETHYQLSRYYLSLQQLEKAEEHLIITIRLNPAHGISHFEYGTLLLNRKDYKNADLEFKMALESEPDNSYYRAMLAFSSVMLGDKKSAQDNISAALRKSPKDPRILYWAGMVYKNDNKQDLALQTFQEALKIEPSNAMCIEAMGDIYLEAIQFKKAAQHYFKAWEKGGFSEQRAFKLGNALSYDGKFVEAKDFYETIINRNPGFSEALYKLIAVYCQIGDFKSARKSLALFKNDGTPWMQLAQGLIFEIENNMDAAFVAYNIARRLAPNNTFVHSGFGRVYLKKNMIDSAIIELSAAAAADTLNMQLLIDLGNAFKGMGDSYSAYQYYLEVDKRYPEHKDVHLLMAQIKADEGRYNEAIHICEKGLKYQPSNAQLYYLLGLQLQKADKFDLAIDAFQTALKKGKGQPIDALRCIGNIYYSNLVNDKKAKEFYKRYVKAGGDSPEVAEAMKKLEGI